MSSTIMTGPPAGGFISIALREGSISTIIPEGAMMDGGIMKLPGGILIRGALRGKVVCAKGFAVIEAGGEFQGELEADNIYVMGTITSRSLAQQSRIVARGKDPQGILFLAALCNVQAIHSARACQISNGAIFNSSTFLTLQQQHDK